MNSEGDSVVVTTIFIEGGNVETEDIGFILGLPEPVAVAEEGRGPERIESVPAVGESEGELLEVPVVFYPSLSAAQIVLEILIDVCLGAPLNELDDAVSVGGNSDHEFPSSVLPLYSLTRGVSMGFIGVKAAVTVYFRHRALRRLAALAAPIK